MPPEIEPSEIVTAGDYSMRDRESVTGEKQANVTYRVSARGGRPLGRGGELEGIAKKDFPDFRAELVRRADAAREEMRARLLGIRDEIRALLKNPDLDIQKRKDLEGQASWAEKTAAKTDPDVASAGIFLKDYENDEVLKRCMVIRGHLNGLTALVDSVRPLFRKELDGDGLYVRADLNMISRAVASSKVDELLGTRILSEEKFGLDPDGKVIGISVMVDGAGVSGSLPPDGTDYFLETDYRRHEVQKGLYDLEAMDYITGQLDRHPGNIFIDPDTGEVRGIDNDIAFPELGREELLAKYTDANKVVVNRPLFLHEDTARRIELMNPEELRSTLKGVKNADGTGGGGLSEESIEGAVTRLNEMKEHVAALRRTGHVVSRFDGSTYAEAIRHQEAQFEQHALANGLKKGAPGSTLDTSTTSDHLSGCPKTSYLGSIALTARRCQYGEEQAEKLGAKPKIVRAGIQHIREATGSSAKAGRSPEHAEFGRLSGKWRSGVKAAFLDDRKGEMDALNARVAACNEQLARLENPSRMDRFKAFFRGGIDKVKASISEKRTGVQEEIVALERQVDAEVSKHYEKEKPNLWDAARGNVVAQKLAAEEKEETALHLAPELGVKVKPEEIPVDEKGKYEEILSGSVPDVRKKMGMEDDEEPEPSLMPDLETVEDVVKPGPEMERPKEPLKELVIEEFIPIIEPKDNVREALREGTVKQRIAQFSQGEGQKTGGPSEKEKPKIGPGTHL